MADAPVMDSPNGNTEAGGSAFDDLMFADSNRDGRVGDQGFGNDPVSYTHLTLPTKRIV